MAPRPNWKGFLKLSLVSCSISLYPATSAGERVSFNQINKNTGNRIRYKKVDGETGEEVNQSDIIKGYQVEKNVYVTVEDEELEALQVESSHTIEIDKFVPLTDIDERYFDAPYYIVPNDEVGQDAFAVIRDAMRGKRMVGLGRVVIASASDRSSCVRWTRAERHDRCAIRTRCGRRRILRDIPDVKVSAEMLKLPSTSSRPRRPTSIRNSLTTTRTRRGDAQAETGGQTNPQGDHTDPSPEGGNVIDLLKRSLEMESKKPKAKASPSRTKARAKERA